LACEYECFIRSSPKIPKELTTFDDRKKWCSKNVVGVYPDNDGSLKFSIKLFGVLDENFFGLE